MNFRYRPPSWILLVTLLIALLVPWFDESVTASFAARGDNVLSELFGRSMFNDQSIGVSDIPVVGAIVAVLSYIVIEALRLKVRPSVRAMLGYVTFCSLATGLILVHGIKIITGRARPSLVLDPGDPFPFTHWFAPGPQDLVRHLAFNGSFPSGHVASISLLLLLVYGVWLRRDSWPLWRLWLWASGLVALVCIVLMTLARMMSKHHWLSDCLMSASMVWLFLDIAARYWYQRLQPLYETNAVPKFWELKMVSFMLLFVLGVILMVTILRYTAATSELLPLVLLPVGAALGVFAWKRIRAAWL